MSNPSKYRLPFRQLFLAATFLVPVFSANGEEVTLAIDGLSEEAVQVYDNWDQPASRIDLTKNDGQTSFRVMVTPITNIPYFDKGLTVALPPGSLSWENFDGLRSMIKSNTAVDVIKFLIEEVDGKYWTASLPFIGTGEQHSYAVAKDQFEYAWGGTGSREKNSPIRRLFISLHSEVKPVGKIDVEFSGVEFVAGMATPVAGKALELRQHWDFASSEGSAMGWKPASGMNSFSVEGGNLTFRMVEDYAYTAIMPVRLDASQVKSLNVSIRAKEPRAASGTVGIYFTSENAPELNEMSKVIDNVRFDERFEEIRIDLIKSPAWEGVITGVRLDFGVPSGTRIEISNIQFE